MHVGWLFCFFIVFMLIATAFLTYGIRIHNKCGGAWRKKKIIAKVACIICFILAIVSLLFFINTFALGKESDSGEIVGHGSTDIIYLAGITLEGESEFLLTEDDTYQFFYYDDNDKIQVGRAKIEDSNKYYGYLDGKACVIITTNHYRVWKSWLCFGYTDDVFTKTYDFYIF